MFTFLSLRPSTSLGVDSQVRGDFKKDLMLVSSRFFAFASLVQGGLKVLCYFKKCIMLVIFSFLHSEQSGKMSKLSVSQSVSWLALVSKVSYNLDFSSLLYFSESGTWSSQRIVLYQASPRFCSFGSLAQGHLNSSIVLSQFLLASLLLGVWYKVISKYRVISQSVVSF